MLLRDRMIEADLAQYWLKGVTREGPRFIPKKNDSARSA